MPFHQIQEVSAHRLALFNARPESSNCAACSHNLPMPFGGCALRCPSCNYPPSGSVPVPVEMIRLRRSHCCLFLDAPFEEPGAARRAYTIYYRARNRSRHYITKYSPTKNRLKAGGPVEIIEIQRLISADLRLAFAPGRHYVSGPKLPLMWPAFKRTRICWPGSTIAPRFRAIRAPNARQGTDIKGRIWGEMISGMQRWSLAASCAKAGLQFW